MCDFSQGIKLCKSENDKIRFREEEFFYYSNGEKIKIKDKRNKNIPEMYIWQLFSYAGSKDGVEKGSYLYPSDDLGNGLNAEWIAFNLNMENCFDFDYLPQEGDNLIIGKNIRMCAYLSFVYKNKEWISDHYNPFYEEITFISNGKLSSL